MSFFIGGNNKVLHITKGVQSAASLSANPIENTVFHSNLNYITIKEIYESSIYNVYIPANANPYYSARTWFNVNAFTKNLMTSYIWFLIDSSGNVMKQSLEARADGVNPTSTDNLQYSGWIDGGLTYQAVELIPDSSIQGGFVSIKANASLGACKICITNILASGEVEYINKTGNDILVSHGNINIKGVPFLYSKYLATSVVNPYDIVGNIGSKTFQILNSIDTSGDIELYSNQNSSGIKKGGHIYIDSEISTNMEILEVTPFTTNLIGLTNIVYTYSILTFEETIPIDSIVILSWTDGYGKNVCSVSIPSSPNFYLIGQELIYRSGVSGDADILRVGITITQNDIIAQVFYYKRIYSGGQGYYPNDPYNIPINMLCTIIGN